MWPLLITDFDVFRNAGRIITSSEPSRLYDTRFQNGRQDPDTAYIGIFVNPPAEALLFAPFSRTSFRQGRSWFAMTSVLAIVGMVVLLNSELKSPIALCCAVAAVVSFLPLYDAVYLGHSDPVYALFVAASLVLVAARRDLAGGAMTGLLALKPTLLLLPTLALLVRRRRAGMAAVAVAAVLGLGPFLITGPSSVGHYIDLVWNRHPDIFRLDSTIANGAALMFNWNGFVSRLFNVDPPAYVIGPLTLLTLAVALAAMLRGTWEEGYFAGVLASLIAVPHMANYDWPLLLPAGIFLAARTRDDLLRGLLMLLDISVNLSMVQHWTRLPSQPSVMLCAPLGVLVLGYLAWRPRNVCKTALDAPDLAAMPA
ncbi:MAG TPA: glycosyltransferase family 87 protein [Dehalococcoidia bacterium]